MNETDNNNRARVRYQKREIFPNPDHDRKKFLNDLSHRLSPSLSFYLFAIIAGIVFGIALLLDSKALIVLTLALLPFAGPFWGMALSCTSGSISFFFKSFSKFLLGIGLFVLGAFAVGGIGRLRSQLSPETIEFFSTIQLLSLITVVVSALLATVLISDKSVQLPVALSNGAMFGVLLPFGLAGYLLGLQSDYPISGSIQTGLIYAVIAMAASVLGFLGRRAFWPRTGSFLMILLVFAGCALFFLNYFNVIHTDVSGAYGAARDKVVSIFVKPTALPTATATATGTATATATLTLTSSPTATATITNTATATLTSTRTLTGTATATAVPPSLTPTQTIPPTETATPTRTLPPSKTPTITFTPSPTIVYGIVAVPDDVGVLIRDSPDYTATVLKSQPNGALLEMMGESVKVNGLWWEKIRTNDGLEGWVAQYMVRTATPVP